MLNLEDGSEKLELGNCPVLKQSRRDEVILAEQLANFYLNYKQLMLKLIGIYITINNFMAL